MSLDLHKKKATSESGKSRRVRGPTKFKKSKEEISIDAIVKKCENLEKINTSTLNFFSDIPLSSETLKGLEECEYVKPTEIQRDSLPFSLTGNDVVGAAKTGSGKTLALIIPVGCLDSQSFNEKQILECLWKARWLRSYGVGALIISPTRELALQTFTILNHVGRHHNFSCALLIGGTDVAYERNRLGTVNIIVCTPGRLLQHMDENEHLLTDQLQILVIDEADRILDMGFSKQINAIVANLPQERQTLLFSATQTKDVKNLTRVCTNDPVFISVHENAASVTPDKLQQSYLVCEEQDKLNTLWSFIQMHKKKKTLVFVSSCKQARFLTDAFCHLRPGLSVMGLWGGMNQTKRIQHFQKFEDARSAMMIATDIASRGLDFSDVDWVIQMDAPVTVEDYIHRVGRTARMEQKGHAVTFLTPIQEPGMIKLLANKNIHLNKLIVDPKAMVDIRRKLQAILAQFSELNQFAQKSLVAYLRSVYLMKDKSIFNVESIDAAALADSYGLVSVPRVRFLAKRGINITNGQKEEVNSDTNEEVSKSLVGHFATNVDEDAELFTVKRSDVFDVLAGADEEPLPIVKGRDAAKQEKKVVSKVKAAKKILNKGVALNKKKVFNEDEEVDEIVTTNDNSGQGLNISEAKAEMKLADKEDRQRLKELKKKKREQTRKNKKMANDDELDLVDDDTGSGINSDAELDWLPDPDEVRKKHAESDIDDMSEVEEPKKKKRKNVGLRKTEEEVLALLSPF